MRNDAAILERARYFVNNDKSFPEYDLDGWFGLTYREDIYRFLQTAPPWIRSEDLRLCRDNYSDLLEMLRHLEKLHATDRENHWAAHFRGFIYDMPLNLHFWPVSDDRFSELLVEVEFQQHILPAIPKPLNEENMINRLNYIMSKLIPFAEGINASEISFDKDIFWTNSKAT